MQAITNEEAMYRAMTEIEKLERELNAVQAYLRQARERYEKARQRVEAERMKPQHPCPI